MCCVNDKIYLVGCYEVKEYNPRSNTWGDLPDLEWERYGGHRVCSLDSKIFVLGDDKRSRGICIVLDLSEDDPEWNYIELMKSEDGDVAVVMGQKIYVLGGGSTTVEVYDVNEGKLMSGNIKTITHNHL